MTCREEVFKIITPAPLRVPFSFFITREISSRRRSDEGVETVDALADEVELAKLNSPTSQEALASRSLGVSFQLT
jgi:hypothetical protein